MNWSKATGLAKFYMFGYVHASSSSRSWHSEHWISGYGHSFFQQSPHIDGSCSHGLVHTMHRSGEFMLVLLLLSRVSECVVYGLAEIDMR